MKKKAYPIPSPGGVKKPKDIIRRLAIEQEIWNRVIAGQSVSLDSIRRMGKTNILKSMLNHPEHGWEVSLTLVQGATSAEEFTKRIISELEKANIISGSIINTVWKKLQAGVEKVQFKDIEITFNRDTWRAILYNVFDSISQSGNRVLVLIDEFSVMLWEMMQDGKADDAKALLNELRNIRETFSGRGQLRFVFSGSIGMKNVIDRLKREYKYSGNPLNNVHKMIIPEMDPDEAQEFCEHFSQWMDVAQKQKILGEVMLNADNIPFYMELFLAEIHRYPKEKRDTVNIQDITNKIINDPAENDQFSHWVDRLSTYYTPEISKYSYQILYYLSEKTGWVPESEIMNHLRHSDDINDDVARKALAELYSNLYLERNIDETLWYKWKYTLAKKWWRINSPYK